MNSRQAARRTPQPQPQPPQRPQPVTVQQVRADVLAAARQLASGRADLLRPLTPCTVAVLDSRYDPPR